METRKKELFLVQFLHMVGAKLTTIHVAATNIQEALAAAGKMRICHEIISIKSDGWVDVVIE